ncbi:hypothetical protein NKI94_30090 [Mesorhizobium australicum]|uniref:hypothetical protein n=1 Tax=Mesorhizobium australicum TaxID=536018 RepID=UPI00333818D7
MEKEGSGADKNRALNDNVGFPDELKTEGLHLLDKAAVSVARLVGRQIARKHFEALRAANDNATEASETQQDGE